MDSGETILRVEHDIEGLPKPNVAQFVLATKLPPRELISTAFVLAFANEQLLLTNLVRRGWDIPGGHLEGSEAPEEAAYREVREETGARLGPLHVLGYQRLRLLTPKPSGYIYPYPEGYQVFYWSHILSLDDFEPSTETHGRALFAVSEAREVQCVQRHEELYQAALAAATC